MNLGRVVALIQARMGSNRFPGKMLQKLGEYTLLEWVLVRVSQAKNIDQVVLATSEKALDNPLVEQAELLGVSVFRGSESDVLGRFANAATHYHAETVLRICADNPFVDPGELERLIIEFKSQPCDYACNHQDRLGSSYADGFGAEIFSNDLLQKIAKISKDSRHREHVTLYIWDHAHRFQLYCLQAPPELAFPEMKFDVDTHSDLIRLNDLVSKGVKINSAAAKIIDHQKLLEN